MEEKPHKKLTVWQKSMVLTMQIYQITSGLPSDEKFGLASQMKRAAVSIPSNIAEGAARFNGKEKVHFFHIARGSLAELDTQVELCCRLGFISNLIFRDVGVKLEEISRLLNGLIASRRSQLASSLSTSSPSARSVNA